MILLCETFTAFLADVGTFAGVKFTVRHQMTLEGERSSALLAHKRPFPAMDARMRQQMMLKGKALLALLTLIWPIR